MNNVQIRIEYDKVGLLKISCPFIISSKEISTVFIYDLIGRKFVEAFVDAEMKFEIEPNDHVVFQLLCDSKNCKLKVFSIKVRTQTVYYDYYEQEETVGVDMTEEYSVELDRRGFRSFSVDDEAPAILRFILAYLIPIELPYQSFYYSDSCEIVKDLRKYFWS